MRDLDWGRKGLGLFILAVCLENEAEDEVPTGAGADEGDKGAEADIEEDGRVSGSKDEVLLLIPGERTVERANIVSWTV